MMHTSLETGAGCGVGTWMGVGLIGDPGVGELCPGRGGESVGRTLIPGTIVTPLGGVGGWYPGCPGDGFGPGVGAILGFGVGTRSGQYGVLQHLSLGSSTMTQ